MKLNKYTEDDAMSLYNHYLAKQKSTFARYNKINEADEKEEEKDDTKTADKKVDKFTTVDEILKQVDLKKMENDVKMELIDTLIDSFQDSSEDEEFAEYMNQLKETIDGYKFEKDKDTEEEDDETEEEDDEDTDVEDDEEDTDVEDDEEDTEDENPF